MYVSSDDSALSSGGNNLAACVNVTVKDGICLHISACIHVTVLKEV